MINPTHIDHNAWAFLKEHVEIHFLLEAVNKLSKFFGPEVSFKIEVPEDPDEPEHQSLLLTVITNLPSEKALAALDNFFNAWWLDQPYAIRKLVVITFASH